MARAVPEANAAALITGSDRATAATSRGAGRSPLRGAAPDVPSTTSASIRSGAGAVVWMTRVGSRRSSSTWCWRLVRARVTETSHTTSRLTVATPVTAATTAATSPAFIDAPPCGWYRHEAGAPLVWFARPRARSRRVLVVVVAAGRVRPPAPGCHPPCDLLFGPVVGGFVVGPPRHLRRPVLLRHPPPRVVVRIVVALAVAEGL